MDVNTFERSLMLHMCAEHNPLQTKPYFLHVNFTENPTLSLNTVLLNSIDTTQVLMHCSGEHSQHEDSTKHPHVTRT